MTWLWKRAPVEDPHRDYKYAITIDSGSSGSRLEIYSWLDHNFARQAANSTEIASLPIIQINGNQKKCYPFSRSTLTLVESILVCYMIVFSNFRNIKLCHQSL